MKAKILIYSLLLLFIIQDNYAQEPVISVGLWNLTHFNGEINLDGFYRGKESTFNQYSESNQSSNFSGGISIKTKSFIWDPRFMTLDVDAEYRPETGKEQFLAIPDRSEVRTYKKLDMKTTFFKQKKVTLSAFANLNQSINNREYLTNLKSNNQRWGANFSYKNKILPFNLNYSQNIWNQEEIASKRVYKMDQKNLQGKAYKSFSKRDFHELVFTHNEYVRQQAELLPIENNIDNINLKNTIYLDDKKRYNFRSIITNFSQYGNLNYTKFQANEFITMKLPLNLSFIGNYQYFDTKQESQNLIQNRIRTTLKHKLYASLNTNVFFEHYNLNQTAYKEFNNKAGINFHYTKKIPKGQLSLSYRYYWHHQEMEAQNTFITIINEEQNLTDGQLVILNRAYIELASVIVKDISGTIIYQPDFDYILIERNNIIEIQRLPGGQIQNNETVYIDYTALQPGSYQYDASNNSFAANIFLFGKLIELYFQASDLKYINFQNVDHLTLNKYTQIVAGGNLDFGFARLGAEYDNYNSNIIPYQRMRYYIQLNKTFYKRMICSLNGNVSIYEKTVEKIHQQFADISGKIAYRFGFQSHISVEFGYRNQQGDGIDLDLLTGRTEFSTSYRQMTFKLGADIYSRNHLSDNTDFYNIYGKIIRKFKL
ncbi:MAG: hypothetical protein P1P88_11435 [Bacteroidales bacterium]|nr:hypothetical protein [Bacteroidales bacterium]